MKFDCGCEFKKFDLNNINLSCPATWDLISKGLTKGLFQIEGSLGRRFCKKIAPSSIEDLADIISLIRPGCLEAEYRENPEDGKMLSITQTYVKVKRGDIAPEYISPVLEPILKDTYSVPVYQEQLMKICTDFAGFTLQEADTARKAVGKKLPKVMAEVEKKFIESAKKQGHSEELAKTIFGWIDKFSGYGFNKSHAISYAMLGYWGAYCKVHFPIEFFKNKLAFSDSSPDEANEIKQLVYEAKLFNINVLPPSVSEMNKEFKFTKDGNLLFGISHIKGIGAKSFSSIKYIKDTKSEFDLFKKLFIDKVKINKGVVESLIKTGAMTNIPMHRIDLLKRLRFFQSLTDRERQYLLKDERFKDESIEVMLTALIEDKIPRGKDRIDKILKAIQDTSLDLGGHKKRMSLAYEKYHLGMPLSGNETELYNNSRVTASCKDFIGIEDKRRVSLGVIIENIHEFKDKRGNWMAFMDVSDATYLIEGVVVFSRAYEKYGWLVKEGRAVLLTGRKRDTSLLVDSIEHL